MKLNSLDNFILMEDLRKSYGFVMPDRREPLTIHQMRLVIPALARLHALTWAYKVTATADGDLNEKFPFFRVHNENGMEAWEDLIHTFLKDEIKVIEERYGPDHDITKGIVNLQKHVKPLCRIFLGKGDENLCYELMRVKPSQREFPGEFWTFESRN